MLKEKKKKAIDPGQSDAMAQQMRECKFASDVATIVWGGIIVFLVHNRYDGALGGFGVNCLLILMAMAAVDLRRLVLGEQQLSLLQSARDWRGRTLVWTVLIVVVLGDIYWLIHFPYATAGWLVAGFLISLLLTGLIPSLRRVDTTGGLLVLPVFLGGAMSVYLLTMQPVSVPQAEMFVRQAGFESVTYEERWPVDVPLAVRDSVYVPTDYDERALGYYWFHAEKENVEKSVFVSITKGTICMVV